MKLPEETEERQGLSTGLVRMLIGVILFITAVLVLILVLNRKEGSGGGKSTNGALTDAAQTEDAAEEDFTPGTLSPEDFDFWDMYPETAEESKEEEDRKTEEETPDPSTDGKHTLVTTSDGKEEWVLISPYLPKHEYDFTKLVCQSELMRYYVDGRQVAYVGADISKYQDYVDFVKLKKSGVDYVMLRVGARGYGTGQLLVDEYFQDNIKRASDAGLEIGLYFFSQAITTQEAEEEAQLVLDSIGEYAVTYPIAIDMEVVQNDTARIEQLSREERTKITKRFLETIEKAGYKSMIFGNKEWLLKKIDLSKLTDYDVWLSQPGDLPDYPYQFTMWQYSTTASVEGIAGYADLNISFVDYSEK